MTLSVYSMMRYLEAREMSPVNSLQPLPYSKSRAAEKHHHQRSENTFCNCIISFPSKYSAGVNSGCCPYADFVSVRNLTAALHIRDRRR